MAFPYQETKCLKDSDLLDGLSCTLRMSLLIRYHGNSCDSCPGLQEHVNYRVEEAKFVSFSVAAIV